MHGPQEQLDPVASGVLFTVNPTTGNTKYVTTLPLLSAVRRLTPVGLNCVVRW